MMGSFCEARLNHNVYWLASRAMWLRMRGQMRSVMCFQCENGIWRLSKIFLNACLYLHLIIRFKHQHVAWRLMLVLEHLFNNGVVCLKAVLIIPVSE